MSQASSFQADATTLGEIDCMEAPESDEASIIAGPENIVLHCCEFSVDSETGETVKGEGCYYEICDNDRCFLVDDPQAPSAPPASDDGTSGRITDRLSDEQEVLPTSPPGTTIPEDTGITDRTVDEREVLPTTPSTSSPLGETSRLQPPPPLTVEEDEAEREQTNSETTPGPETCMKGEIFNEQTEQCESPGESETKEPEDPAQTNPEEQQPSDENGSGENGNN